MERTYSIQLNLKPTCRPVFNPNFNAILFHTIEEKKLLMRERVRFGGNWADWSDWGKVPKTGADLFYLYSDIPTLHFLYKNFGSSIQAE